jgi:hypothetical protein
MELSKQVLHSLEDWEKWKEWYRSRLVGHGEVPREYPCAVVWAYNLTVMVLAHCLVYGSELAKPLESLVPDLVCPKCGSRLSSAHNGHPTLRVCAGCGCRYNP